MSSPAFTVRMPPEHADESFAALGTTVRLLVQAPRAAGRVATARAAVHAAEARLSRFRPDSELCALNADPRAVVPASALLRGAVRAALRAAELSRGLVDPCLLDALEAAGYRRSLVRDRGTAIAPAHPPGAGSARPARPHPAARWREVRVDDGAGTVTRPPGVRLDLGGSGKGFIADRVAALLAPAAGWVVDAGGDLRLGGAHEVLVAHPLGPEPAARLRLRDTAVATSSVVARAWRTADGARAHHLLDPATGAPAWTGVLSASAIAPSVLEAETLAKTALLSGPAAGRSVLAARGGLLVLTDGTVEPIPAAGTGPRASGRPAGTGPHAGRRFGVSPAGTGPRGGGRA